jgi:hypothetical protein
VFYGLFIKSRARDLNTKQLLLANSSRISRDMIAISLRYRCDIPAISRNKKKFQNSGLKRIAGLNNFCSRPPQDDWITLLKGHPESEFFLIQDILLLHVHVKRKLLVIVPNAGRYLLHLMDDERNSEDEEAAAG